MVSVQELIQNGEFSLDPEKYAILKTTKFMEDALACIKTKTEHTIIATERAATHTLPRKEILEIDKDWRLISFEMELPFELVGFLSHVSKALADAGVSIFILSTFSTDLLMIKEAQLEKTIQVLKELGLSLRA